MFTSLSEAANTLGTSESQVSVWIRDGAIRARVVEQTGGLMVLSSDIHRAKDLLTSRNPVTPLWKTKEVPASDAGKTGFEMLSPQQGITLVEVVQRLTALEMALAPIPLTMEIEVPDLVRSFETFLNGSSLFASPESIRSMAAVVRLVGPDQVGRLVDWASTRQPRYTIHTLLSELATELVDRARSLPGSEIQQSSTNRILGQCKAAAGHLRSLALACALCEHTLLGDGKSWVPAGMVQLDHMVARRLAYANRT